jgi:hypothetical protein
MRAALVCLSGFGAWGFGVCRPGLWARPRPGALGGALVMPRKTWSRPVLPPPKFPGVAMESCLNLNCRARAERKSKTSASRREDAGAPTEAGRPERQGV